MQTKLTTQLTTQLTTVLALLLSHRKYRDQFNADREGYLLRYNLPTVDYRSLLTLESSQLEKQAQVLLNKRWREVSALLPITMQNVGIEAKEHFWGYAQSNWPVGSLRHFEDSYLFCRYLIRNFADKLNKTEMYRMELINKRKRISLHFTNQVPFKPNRTLAMQILLRLPGGNIHESYLYLGL